MERKPINNAENKWEFPKVKGTLKALSDNLASLPVVTIPSGREIDSTKFSMADTNNVLANRNTLGRIEEGILILENEGVRPLSHESIQKPALIQVALCAKISLNNPSVGAKSPTEIAENIATAGKILDTVREEAEARKLIPQQSEESSLKPKKSALEELTELASKVDLEETVKNPIDSFEEIVKLLKEQPKQGNENLPLRRELRNKI